MTKFTTISFQRLPNYPWPGYCSELHAETYRCQVFWSIPRPGDFAHTKHNEQHYITCVFSILRARDLDAVVILYWNYRQNIIIYSWILNVAKYKTCCNITWNCFSSYHPVSVHGQNSIIRFFNAIFNHYLNVWSNILSCFLKHTF